MDWNGAGHHVVSNVRETSTTVCLTRQVVLETQEACLGRLATDTELLHATISRLLSFHKLV